jgi:hypothetical protein
MLTLILLFGICLAVVHEVVSSLLESGANPFLLFAVSMALSVLILGS